MDYNSQGCCNHSNCLWNYAIHPANYLALLAKLIPKCKVCLETSSYLNLYCFARKANKPLGLITQYVTYIKNYISGFD